MKIQTLLVQKIGVQGVSKYTFSEITMCEACNHRFEDKDFEKNQVPN